MFSYDILKYVANLIMLRNEKRPGFTPRRLLLLAELFLEAAC